MLYKTIVLELLKDRPQMYEELRRDRMLLQTMVRMALELKSSHETWKSRLSKASPDTSESQIDSEAAELALKALVDSLPSESPDEDETALPLA